MKKFQTMGELIAYMVGANAPNALKTTACLKTKINNTLQTKM